MCAPSWDGVTTIKADLQQGRFDPDAYGVKELMAVRAAAGTATPWDGAATSCSGAKGAASSSETVPAEHGSSKICFEVVPVCGVTVKLVQAATRGWSPATHWLHHTKFKVWVHTILLVSERLGRVADAAARGDVYTVRSTSSIDESGGRDVQGKTDAVNVALALEGMVLQEMLADDAAPALAGMVLPEMPPELWALALGFLARRDLYTSA
jgi:hypothetical protein